jgi:hypothetical protein
VSWLLHFFVFVSRHGTITVSKKVIAEPKAIDKNVQTMSTLLKPIIVCITVQVNQIVTFGSRLEPKWLRKQQQVFPKQQK